MLARRRVSDSIIAMTALLICYQNYRPGNPSQIETPAKLLQLNPGQISYLKISMRQHAAFYAEPGLSYPLKVEASKDILARGIDSGASRWVKLGGSCHAADVLNWGSLEDSSVKIKDTLALLKEGASSSWTYLDAKTAQASELPVDIARVSSEALPVAKENYLDFSLLDSAAKLEEVPLLSRDAHITATQENPIQKNRSLASVEEESKLGDSLFHYPNSQALRLGGCDWLACVRSKSGLEACIKVAALKSSP